VLVAGALMLLAYACGSIPSGVLLARRAGVDVRHTGSGNIGAANVARTAGMALGLATLVADAAKGLLPVALAQVVSGGDAVPAAAGLAAFLGHLFPPGLHFAGGKGVATAFGVSLALVPNAAGIAAAGFLVGVLVTRRVSVGSLLAATMLPIAAAAFAAPRAELLASLVMSGLVILRHRDNVGRLLAGTEPALVLKKQASPDK
jgi:glycerol-3-phosphate acyltransferase PlsY